MSIAAQSGPKVAYDRIFVGLVAGLGLLLSLFWAARTIDHAFRIESFVMLAASVMAICALVFGGLNHKLENDHSKYMDGVVRAGVIASMFWAIVGLLVGCVIAGQLAFPHELYFSDYGFLNFGRLRPVHTSGVIFAFGGNVLIATSFYVVQRTCKARLFGGTLPWFVFWGYQLFIVLAALGYVLGITQAKEYAEPEWFVDLWLTLVWVVYLLVFLGTLWKRQEQHIYVANWFYLAFIVTIALLHIVNNLSLPINWMSSQSISVMAGVQGALTQWWYGHNAVGFFLTAGFLAIMYYFVPKAVNRPVYSYRLSIVHFWALIFIYIWAGPHHLHYTALPQWAQTLGATFSVMLWMPSWGGMINGLMTLSGAWDKLRTDPVVRMLVASIAFYGMATFEGPLMSIRTVNALSHYTDWTIGHVHSGALGWVGFVSFGALYCLVPWLWKKDRLYSSQMVEWHFWLGTFGLLLYICALWVSGIMEGLMWRAYTPEGFLQYSFVESVQFKVIPNIVRLVGGLFYLSGAVIMAVNLWLTVRMKSSDATSGQAFGVPAQPGLTAAE